MARKQSLHETIQRISDSLSKEHQQADLDGYVKELCELFEKKVKISYNDDKVIGVVILAASKGELELLKQLHELGADINRFSYSGLTPLISAVTGGHKECVDFLLNQGARTDSFDDTGKTAVMHAVINQHVDCLDLLIAKGADLNERNKSGRTPLIFSIINKDFHAAQRLINQGANVNTSDFDGNTPLMYATARKNTRLMTVLISKGANVNARNKDGDTVLYRACTDENESETDIIRIVKVLTDRKANIHMPHLDGKTPLIYAINSFKTELLEHFIEASANSNTPLDGCDKHGRTALDYAAFHNCEEAVRLLVQRVGLKCELPSFYSDNEVEHFNREGPYHPFYADQRRALLWIIYHDNNLILKILIDSNPNIVNHVLCCGISMVMLCVQEGKLNCLRCLIEHGADLKQLDVKRRSAKDILTVSRQRLSHFLPEEDVKEMSKLLEDRAQSAKKHKLSNN